MKQPGLHPGRAAELAALQHHGALRLPSVPLLLELLLKRHLPRIGHQRHNQEAEEEVLFLVEQFLLMLFIKE